MNKKLLVLFLLTVPLSGCDTISDWMASQAEEELKKELKRTEKELSEKNERIAELKKEVDILTAKLENTSADSAADPDLKNVGSLYE